MGADFRISTKSNGRRYCVGKLNAAAAKATMAGFSMSYLTRRFNTERLECGLGHRLAAPANNSPKSCHAISMSLVDLDMADQTKLVTLKRSTASAKGKQGPHYD
jgi:hypothetical protein